MEACRPHDLLGRAALGRFGLVGFTHGNVEDVLAERGIDISHETVRFW